ADSEEALADELVDAWASELASRYAVTGGRVQTGPRLKLAVEGIATAGDYAAAKQALSRLNPVRSVGAVEVAGDRIVFLVEHSGEVEQLQQNLALDERFRALEGQSRARDESDEDSAEEGFRKVEQTLDYHWQQQVVQPSGAIER
ncbi:MAG: hypothetical protein ACOCVV_12415, partial [Marinobacter sp.]